MSRIMNRYAAPLVCIALVLCFVVAQYSFSGPRFGAKGDADRYHWQVAKKVRGLPEAFGPWEGRNIPTYPPIRAVASPNVVYSKRYIHRDSAIQVDLLFVQNRAIGDMAAYEASEYYGEQGCYEQERRPKYWTIDDSDFFGTRFEFTCLNEAGTEIQRCVDQCIILPNGQITGELASVHLDREFHERTRYLGAAQFHIVTDGALTEIQRDEIFMELMMAFEDIIKTLRSGADG